MNSDDRHKEKSGKWVEIVNYNSNYKKARKSFTVHSNVVIAHCVHFFGSLVLIAAAAHHNYAKQQERFPAGKGVLKLY